MKLVDYFLQLSQAPIKTGGYLTIIRSVDVLVRDSRGRTLLQFRDAATQTYPLLWGFWGGRYSPVDLSPAHCAARELAEELELTAAPADFTRVGIRASSLGEAWLMRYHIPVEWGEFRVREGSGAGFFYHEDLLKLSLSKPVAHYIQIATELFKESA